VLVRSATSCRQTIRALFAVSTALLLVSGCSSHRDICLTSLRVVDQATGEPIPFPGIEIVGNLKEEGSHAGIAVLYGSPDCVILQWVKHPYFDVLVHSKGYEERPVRILPGDIKASMKRKVEPAEQNAPSTEPVPTGQPEPGAPEDERPIPGDARAAADPDPCSWVHS
jgi:hypothetical protein